MESLGTAVLELVADIKPLAAGLEKGKLAAEEMASTTAQGFKGGIQKAAIPAAAAVGALVIGLHKSVEAAQEDQVATARLAAAFTDAGVPFKAYSGAIEDAVSKSAALGFKSNDVKQALGSLVVATHSGTKAIQLLSTAQDIARFKGISLDAASKILTQTMAGSTRGAHMLGIQVQTLKDKHAQAAEVIDLVNQKLHGQAQAYADTAAGARDKMGAELQLLEENIGKTLLPALTAVTDALATASEWMSKHGDVAKVLIGILGGLALGVLAVNAALKLQAAATAVAEAAQWAFNAALSANPIGIVVIALAALGTALVVAWDKSKTFREIVLGVWDDVKTATREFINFFTQKVPDAFQSVREWLSSKWGAVKGAITSPFSDAWDYINDIPGKIVDAFRGVKGDILSAFSSIGSAVGSVFKAPINAIIGAIDAIELPSGVHIKTWHGIPDGFSIEWSHPFHIPMLAEGGIVNSPTVAMIGEAGPEAVVPLKNGGLGPTINVNIDGRAIIGDHRDVATKIARELESMSRSGMQFQIATTS